MKTKHLCMLFIILSGFMAVSFVIYKNYQSTNDIPNIKENVEDNISDDLNIENKEDKHNKENLQDIDNNSNKYTLYLFHGETCPACLNAKEKIKKDLMDISNLEIITYEIWNNQDNSALMDKVAEKLGVEVNYIPFFVINTFNKVGYDKDDVLNELKNDNKDIVKEVLEENPQLKPVFEKLK